MNKLPLGGALTNQHQHQAFSYKWETQASETKSFSPSALFHSSTVPQTRHWFQTFPLSAPSFGAYQSNELCLTGAVGPGFAQPPLIVSMKRHACRCPPSETSSGQWLSEQILPSPGSQSWPLSGYIREQDDTHFPAGLPTLLKGNSLRQIRRYYLRVTRSSPCPVVSMAARYSLSTARPPALTISCKTGDSCTQEMTSPLHVHLLHIFSSNGNASMMTVQGCHPMIRITRGKRFGF